MNGDQPGGSTPVPQPTSIKRETSDGLDGDTNMADIPESADAAPATRAGTEPRSSQPPASQTNGSSESKPPASMRATKKKGTATLVKKTTSRKARGGSRARRARGGGRGGSTARPKTSNTASSPASGLVSSEAGSADEEEEESDHGPYCLCRGPDDHRWMISCDVCEDWYHGECVSIDKTIGEALIQRYVCPLCTDDKGINVTRYKKTCSFEGCINPARIYDEEKKGVGAAAGTYSVFCSDKHAEDWWEQLVRSLPENRSLKSKKADLTREKFMGLLGASTVYRSVEGEDPWHIGKKPFGKQLFNPWKGRERSYGKFSDNSQAVPSEFWSAVDPSLVFTPEEQSFLSTSAADRYALAEEIVMNKKMQLILDLANERRKAAITTGLIDKDTCGYDVRLDMVGCPIEFAHFVKSPQGEAIYKNNSLTAEGTFTEEQLQWLKDEALSADKDWNPATAGMCDRRRCKPHVSWYNIFTKSTRHIIKELARQAKEKLDAETRVREAAATRYFRRQHERTSVRRLDDETVVS